MCVRSLVGFRDAAIVRTVSKGCLEVRAPMPSLKHVERDVPLAV